MEAIRRVEGPPDAGGQAGAEESERESMRRLWASLGAPLGEGARGRIPTHPSTDPPPGSEPREPPFEPGAFHMTRGQIAALLSRPRPPSQVPASDGKVYGAGWVKKPGQAKMPFGMYKGWKLAEIARRDRQYVEWLARDWDEPTLRWLANRLLDGLTGHSWTRLYRSQKPCRYPRNDSPTPGSEPIGG